MTKGQSIDLGLAECAHQGAESEKGEGVDVDAENVQEMKCGTCSNGKKVLIKEHDTGAVRCEFMKRWEWLPGRMPCSFNPSKWVSK
jgi:hypothetical protein